MRVMPHQKQRHSQLSGGKNPVDQHLKHAAHNLPQGYIAVAGIVPCL